MRDATNTLAHCLHLFQHQHAAITTYPHTMYVYVLENDARFNEPAFSYILSFLRIFFPTKIRFYSILKPAKLLLDLFDGICTMLRWTDRSVRGYNIYSPQLFIRIYIDESFSHSEPAAVSITFLVFLILLYLYLAS